MPNSGPPRSLPVVARGPAPTPRIRFMSIEQQHAHFLEAALNSSVCYNVTFEGIPRGLPPAALLAFTALHPDTLTEANRFPGFVFLLYDCGPRSVGGRTAAIFSRMNSTAIDVLVDQWEDLKWVRQQSPPSMVVHSREQAMANIEQLATWFIQAWHRSLDAGEMTEAEPMREIHGEAHGALLKMIMFWIKTFQF